LTPLSVSLHYIVNSKTKYSMKTLTQRFTLTVNKGTGEVVEASNNGNLLATALPSGDAVWFPAKATPDKFITYKVHEKGDTFVATSDSSQTKGEVLDTEALEALAKERKLKVEDIKDEPLFEEGETVTRQKQSIEFIGFTADEFIEKYSFRVIE